MAGIKPFRVDSRSPPWNMFLLFSLHGMKFSLSMDTLVCGYRDEVVVFKIKLENCLSPMAYSKMYESIWRVSSEIIVLVSNDFLNALHFHHVFYHRILKY